MITKEEVEKIAKLSRLDLSEEEIQKMQKDLSAILDYFNLLKSAPKPENGQEQYAKLSPFRKDEVVPRDVEAIQRIIAAFPDKKDDYIKVKAIF